MQRLITERGCFAASKGLLELIPIRQKGWYIINTNRVELRLELIPDEQVSDKLKESPKNKIIYIAESAFDKAEKGNPLALGFSYYGFRGGLSLYGDHDSNAIAQVTLSSKAQAEQAALPESSALSVLKKGDYSNV